MKKALIITLSIFGSSLIAGPSTPHITKKDDAESVLQELTQKRRDSYGKRLLELQSLVETEKNKSMPNDPIFGALTTLEAFEATKQQRINDLQQRINDLQKKIDALKRANQQDHPAAQ